MNDIAVLYFWKFHAQPVTVHFIIQRPPGNAQDLAGPGPVSPGVVQGPDNQFFFYLGQRHPHTDGHPGLPVLVLADPAGQVAGPEYIFCGRDNRTLDGVFQFPDVARPGIGLNTVDKIRRHAPDIFLETVAGLFDKVAHQQGDVAVAFPQRRHFNAQDIQSVIQILSEVAQPDLIFKV